MRLFPKLLLSLVAVVVLAVGIAAALANRVAQREVSGLIASSGMAGEGRLALELADYYRRRGSWDGVQLQLRPGQRMGQLRGLRLVLANTDGQVVADSASALFGRQVASADLAAGVPVLVGEAQVGTLLVYEPRGLRLANLDLLQRVNRAIWLAALGAGAVAVLVGAMLAYGLLRPIRALTQATSAVAQGRLSQRVNIDSDDEIGDLAAAFNRMAASLEAAERQRQEMTADIAHELRNPIAVLQGNLEAVIDGVLPPNPENLEPMLDQTRLLARLVDDLRTLALADAGRLSLELAPTNPGDLMRGALAQFQTQAEAKDVRLEGEAPADLPSLALDAQRMGQVLGNLLSNAIRHTPPGGRVQLHMTMGRDKDSNKPRLLVSVTDSGPGIAPEALAHIFERFYRAGSSRARTEGGTGLGLAIARQIVVAHGGDIWAESQPGQGATVSFSLPLPG